jgi:tetratricopeptide (TPR) repeat protein
MTRAWLQSLLFGTRLLQAAGGLALTAVIASAVVLGAYYVWDCYPHLDGRPTIELGIEQMEEGVGQEPHNAKMPVAFAGTHLLTDQYDMALDQAEEVLTLYRDTAAVLLIAGMANACLQRPEAALAPLKRFTMLRKDEPMAGADQALEAAYYFLGESYVKLDRPAEAIPVLQAALAVSSTNADALYQLGLAHQATGQVHAALESFREAVQLVPDFAPAYLGMGLTYERMDRLDAALVAVRRANELDPRDLATQQALRRLRLTLDSQN